MKITLIGGGGRLGKSLIIYSRKSNLNCTFNIVGRRDFNKLDHEFREILSSQDSYYEEKDIEEAISNSDKVIIFLPSSGVNYNDSDKFEYIKRIIIPKTCLISEKCNLQSKHLILLSSGAVYASKSFDDNLDIGPKESSELKELNEINGYAYVKLMQEKIVRKFMGENYNNCTILRLFSISDYFFTEPVFAIENIIQQANTFPNKPLILNNPNIYRSFISAFDISKIIHKIFNDSIYGIFNLSGIEVVSLQELAKISIGLSSINKEIIINNDILIENKINRNNYYGNPTKSFQLLKKESFESLDFQIRKLTARVKFLMEKK